MIGLLADTCLTAEDVQWHNGVIAVVVAIGIVAALAHLVITWEDSKADRERERSER